MLKWKLRLFIAGFCLFSSVAYAVSPGFYLGLMAGPARVNKKTVNPFPGVFVRPNNSNPFAARLYLGYDFSCYAGVEFGGTYFSRVAFKETTFRRCPDSRPTSQVSTIDLVGKLMLPLGPFDVFGKAGVAATYENATSEFHPELPCGERKREITYRPTYSVGVSYDLSQNWVVDLTYTRVNAKGIVDDIQWLALGFSYHFVDIYCGQFLC